MEDEYPQLSAMARDFLSVSGAGVAMERKFSHGADLCSAKRMSMRAETINQVLCLRDWLRRKRDTSLVNLEYVQGVADAVLDEALDGVEDFSN